MTITAPAITWSGLVPVLTILTAGVLGVLVEAFVPRRARLATHSVLGLGAILLALVGVSMRWSDLQGVITGQNTGRGFTPVAGLMEDPFAVASQGIMLLIGFLALLVMIDRTSAGDTAFAAQAADRPGSAEERESAHAGFLSTEVLPLSLFSLAGMMLFPMSTTFITLFVALEMVSLPLYIMAATARHRRLLSQEAAMKYFILGAFASGFFLMGAAFLYGFSGSLSLAGVHSAFQAQGAGGVNGMDLIAVSGMAMVTIGLLFKVAAVPFHAWSPDVYQGAPTPVTGFMAAGVKATAFLTLARFYYEVAGMAAWDLGPFLWAVAIATMLVGTVVGLVQQDIKRVLAYSAIAHAGYMLLGIITDTQVALSALLFYALAYGASTVGAFGIISLVRRRQGDGIGAEATRLDDWRGLGQRHPVMGAAMSLFLLSFAGIPLTAGFTGKFALFGAALGRGGEWLVIAAVISSAATAFFYMRVIVLMFFHDPQPRAGSDTVVVGSQGPALVGIALAVILTIALGVFPGPVLELAANAAMLIL